MAADNPDNMNYSREKVKTYTNPSEIITIKNGEQFTTRFTGPINPS
jgi:hypothetical protein